MNNKEKTEVFAKLSEDEAFLSALKNAESKDELKAIFEENGLPLSKEEVDTFVELAMRTINDDELTDDEMENVAGGAIGPEWIVTTAISYGSKVVKACWNAGKKFANWENSIGGKKK